MSKNVILNAVCEFRVIASLLFRRSNLLNDAKIASSQKTLLAMTHKKNSHTALILIILLFQLGLLVEADAKIVVPVTPALLAPHQNVKVVGRRLMTDFDGDGNYTPYLIKGVGYSPYPWARHPSDWGYPLGDPRQGNPNFPANIFDDPVILDNDFNLLKAIKANTIRIWSGADNSDPTQPGRFPVKLTQRLLDKAEQYELKVVAGFWLDHPGDWVCSNNGQGPWVYNQNVSYAPGSADRARMKQKFAQYVQQFKNHPAILFWAIGNEENLHLRDSNHARDFYNFVNELAGDAHQIEGPYGHPVAALSGDVGYIGMPGVADDVTMFNLDIWGINIYRGSSFGNLFVNYAAISQKPLWPSEFGEDAWHTNDFNNPQNGYEDQTTQALRLYSLWQEIQINFNSSTQVAIGGSVMEFADEWWKPYEWLCGTMSPQCNSQQDYFGTGPADLSCPKDGVPDWTPASADQFINDEWWGIFFRQKNSQQPSHDSMIPRLAAYLLQLIW